MQPGLELVLDRFDDGFEESKVAIMETEPASEFPDPLDGVEFGTIRRKKIESESGLLFSPGQVQSRAVVLGIIADQDDAAAFGGAGLAQEFQKLPEAFAVEPASLAAVKELTVAEPYRTKVSYAAARRVMVEDGIPDFGRHPHATARPVLLEMHFVQCPQIDTCVPH